ncbi:MAG TPA: hypothetical protein ENH60_04350 [Pricia sp.]|nr:hypothetical protein [Pricia sp.]
MSETGAALTNSQTTTDDSGVFFFWIDDGDFPSTQKFRIIGTKPGFADLDNAQTDNIQIIVSISSTTETFTNKTINTASNTITIIEADISDLGTAIALIADNLGVFAATTSLQLLGVISDPEGTGALVFGISPTIVTPTIASFANAGHDHADAPGGGDLGVVQATNLTLTGAAIATPVANRLYTDNIIKAFCSWVPNGTIDTNGDVNVSSVDQDGTGRWGVNLATAFSAATSFAVTVSCQADAAGSVDNIIAIDNAGNGTNAIEIRSVSVDAGGATETDPVRMFMIAVGTQ